jgi:pyruvate/2-oxoglutarate dehydrogenase complex dihydrolipoamide acyltransferase (E2) component
MAADTIVKVPQMAESITEGTLKQWSKREDSQLALRKPR